jgi:hypothetical protein
MEEQESVEEIILGKLASSSLSESAADLIIAALIGEDELASAISGEQVTVPPAPVAQSGLEPHRAYLRSVTVEGFRGIGPRSSLHLQPGPGLTLVVGRNGSGKSSFAEAAELALTGVNKRWSGVGHSTERAGWRNLHAPDISKIDVELARDGEPGVTVTREWKAGADLEDATVYAQTRGAPRQSPDSLGWGPALELYRPFLSYAELGALVSGKPADMYDVLQAILGLDQLIVAEKHLADARKKAESDSKLAKQDRVGVLDQLRDNPDLRARGAETELGRRIPDLDAIEALATSENAGNGQVSDYLGQVTGISLPGIEAVSEAAERLAVALDGVNSVSSTPAANARRQANLFRVALEHYAEHQDEPCPVCRGRSLDETWATETRSEISRLTQLATDADAAHTKADDATRALTDLVPPMPAVLAADLGDELDTTDARAAWGQWAALAADPNRRRFAAEANDIFSRLAPAVAGVQVQARAVQQRRSEVWRPAAAALSRWILVERASRQAATAVGNLKQAIAWLKDTGNQIRNDRLEPFAGMSASVWEALRQESNVELGPVRLTGTSTQRKVALEVTVDGVPGAALSVMSQGELHALGLALFLPRATAANSPFRFLVIDDPVQSMDPSKVDGLARVLHKVAADRQVVVFTHDDRLPEAIRRLQLPATIWQVVRRERSVVELTLASDPVATYLDDARALARTPQLPQQARTVAVAGYCRSALDAACHEIVRARRISAGARHQDVEQALSDAHTTKQKLALVLFDGTSGDVMDRVRQMGGAAAVNAVNVANAGVHGTYEGDLIGLVNETDRLVKALKR